LTTRDTVPNPTPARRATSIIVGRLASGTVGNVSDTGLTSFSRHGIVTQQ
jgi:hypothetical protein